MVKHKLLGLVACGALAWSVVACDNSDDGTSGVASATGTDGSASDSNSDSGSSSSDSADADSDPSTTTDASTSTTSDTSGCTPDDPCQTDDDCDVGAGESCLGCVCIGGGSSDSASGTDSGGTSDPSYPNPADGCPAGYVDGNMATNPGINICIPACDGTQADAIAACPQPTTGGMAIGVCNLTAPGGTPTACTMDEALMACGDMDGFYCLGDGMGGYNCDERIACLLVCDAAQAPCPPGLTCNGGVCEY
jgi:hypothetical protein